MNIHILEKTPQIQRKYLTYLEKRGHILYGPNQVADKSTIDVIMIRSAITCDKTLLESYPHLKYVCRVGVGIEHIDQEYCQKRGITILNTPGANADAVADLAIRGSLSLARKTKKVVNQLHVDRFTAVGRSLHEYSVGLIGYGNIAKKIRQRLVGYGVSEFFFFDPFVQEGDGIEKLEAVDDVVSSANLIFLCLPLIPQTTHLVNQSLLTRSSDHTLRINTSRGAIVDEQAMYQYLVTRPEAGYYADVWEGEPTITDQVKKLLSLDNVQLTPHIGAITNASHAQMHYFDLPKDNLAK